MATTRNSDSAHSRQQVNGRMLGRWTACRALNKRAGQQTGENSLPADLSNTGA